MTETKYICGKCGSSEIRACLPVWVDPNNVGNQKKWTLDEDADFLWGGEGVCYGKCDGDSCKLVVDSPLAREQAEALRVAEPANMLYKAQRAAREVTGQEAECDDPACPGWFVDCETLEVTRCDQCQQFESDDDAKEFVDRSLLGE